MTRVNTITTHPQLDDIDRDLLTNNGTMQEIADRYDVSLTPLKNHKQAGAMQERIRLSVKAEEILDSDRLVGHMEDARKIALQIVAEAHKSGNPKLQLQALDRCITTLGKLLDAGHAIREDERRREQHALNMGIIAAAIEAGFDSISLSEKRREKFLIAARDYMDKQE